MRVIFGFAITLALGGVTYRSATSSHIFLLMFPLRNCSRLAFSCLLFASAVSPLGFAQSSASQNKAPVVAPTATKQWTGDLDVLLKHQVIRVGVPYTKTLYYTVKGTQYGIAYEGGKAFEEYLK
jgi:hypothetical protein